MQFEFATASRVVFGPGVFNRLGAIAEGLGTRVLLVTGRSPDRGAAAGEMLKRMRVSRFVVGCEPTVELVSRGVETARQDACDVVVGLGGGSVIDAAKAIAALLRNPGDIFDYLEVIGRGKALAAPSIPCIAIPTTAGTGAEVTRNAVLASPEHKVKVSLRSVHMLPAVALVDPELTVGLPPGLTAATGLDALTQLLEPFVSARANPMVDALCREGIRRAARSLEVAFREPGNMEARADMALASLFGGMALANAGLGAVHGFAGPLGGMYPAPHGAVCGILLPPVMAANWEAIRSRYPGLPAGSKFGEAARLLSGEPGATAEEGISWVKGLVGRLGLPGLSAYGVRGEHIPEIVEKAMKASSMKANPVALSAVELESILSNAL
jgi:alcohol dehydrogenase class IV